MIGIIEALTHRLGSVRHATLGPRRKRVFVGKVNQVDHDRKAIGALDIRNDGSFDSVRWWPDVDDATRFKLRADNRISVDAIACTRIAQSSAKPRLRSFLYIVTNGFDPDQPGTSRVLTIYELSTTAPTIDLPIGPARSFALPPCSDVNLYCTQYHASQMHPWLFIAGAGASFDLLMLPLGEDGLPGGAASALSAPGKSGWSVADVQPFLVAPSPDGQHPRGSLATELLYLSQLYVGSRRYRSSPGNDEPTVEPVLEVYSIGMLTGLADPRDVPSFTTGLSIDQLQALGLLHAEAAHLYFRASGRAIYLRNPRAIRPLSRAFPPLMKLVVMPLDGPGHLPRADASSRTVIFDQIECRDFLLSADGSKLWTLEDIIHSLPDAAPVDVADGKGGIDTFSPFDTDPKSFGFRVRAYDLGNDGLPISGPTDLVMPGYGYRQYGMLLAKTAAEQVLALVQPYDWTEDSDPPTVDPPEPPKAIAKTNATRRLRMTIAPSVGFDTVKVWFLDGGLGAAVSQDSAPVFDVADLDSVVVRVGEYQYKCLFAGTEVVGVVATFRSSTPGVTLNGTAHLKVFEAGATTPLANATARLIDGRAVFVVNGYSVAYDNTLIYRAQDILGYLEDCKTQITMSRALAHAPMPSSPSPEGFVLTAYELATFSGATSTYPVRDRAIEVLGLLGFNATMFSYEKWWQRAPLMSAASAARLWRSHAQNIEPIDSTHPRMAPAYIQDRDGVDPQTSVAISHFVRFVAQFTDYPNPNNEPPADGTPPYPDLSQPSGPLLQLYDEPSYPLGTALDALDPTVTRFFDYCAAEGFNVDSTTLVADLAAARVDRAQHSELWYHACSFVLREFSSGGNRFANAIRKFLPKCYPYFNRNNFYSAQTISGNGVFLDWLEPMSACAFTEDEFFDSDAVQTSYLADLLRAAARVSLDALDHQPVLLGLDPTDPTISDARASLLEYGCHFRYMRAISDNPDIKLMRLYSMIGHGAKLFSFYSTGPHPFGSDAWLRPWIREMRPTFGAIAKAIDFLRKDTSVTDPRLKKLLAYGRPPLDVEIAFVLPRTSYIWSKATELPFERELQALHCALTHAGFRVDFIDERAASGKKPWRNDSWSGYKVIYLFGPNLARQAAENLVAWVKAGGVLALLPGAAVADDFNRDLDELTTLAGLTGRSRLSPEQTNTTGNLAEPFAYVPTTTDRVDLTVPVIDLQAGAAAPPLDLLSDSLGRTILRRQAHGAGCVVSYGFLPGICYQTNSDREPTNSRVPSNGSDLPGYWNADARRLALWPVVDSSVVVRQSVKRIGTPLFEVCRLDVSDANGTLTAIALVIINWGWSFDRRLPGVPMPVDIEVDRLPGSTIEVFADSTGSLPVGFTAVSPDSIRFTVGVQAVDVVRIVKVQSD
jgi:hypothetical protein